MVEDPRLAEIKAIAVPVIEGNAMELVDCFSRPQGRQHSVCFIVDAPGGVTIQRCAKVNRLIRQALEEAALLATYESIEVSSPGLDRPLKTARDFERALGEEVDIHYDAGNGRLQRLKAMVLAVQPEAIVLKSGAETITVSLDTIKQATKALPW